MARNLWVTLGLKSGAFDKGLKKSRGQLKGFSSQVKAFAATMGAGIGLHQLSRGISQSVRAFATFEKGMAQVSTMLDEQTMKLLPTYSKQIRSLSKEMGESTSTLAGGLYDVLSASVDASKAMKVLKVAAKAAKGGLTDTATAADAITTILNSYNMAAEEATTISDKMFATIKRGKLTFADYAPNIGKVASLAATAGVAFEDLNASIATLTRAGVQTEIAMTGIRGTIASLIDPSKEAIEAAAEFGLTLDENTLRTTGLVGMMDKLRDANLQQLGAIIPNIRALAGFAAGIQNADGAMKDLKMQYNSTGIAQEATSKLMDTTATKLDILKQRWVDFKVELGEGLAAPLIGFMNTVAKIAGKFRQMKEDINAINEILGGGGKPGSFGNFGMELNRTSPGQRGGKFKDDVPTIGLSEISNRSIPIPQQGGVGGLQVPGGFISPSAGTAFKPTGAGIAEVQAKGSALQDRITEAAKQEQIFNTHMNRVINRERHVGVEEGLQKMEALRNEVVQIEIKALEEKNSIAAKAAEKLKRENDAAANLVAEKWNWVATSIGSSMTTAFDRIAFEGGKLRDIMSDFGRSIARDLAHALVFAPASKALVSGARKGLGLPMPVKESHSGGTVPYDGLYQLQRGEHVQDRVGAKSGNSVNVVIENNSGVPLQQDGPARIEPDKYIISVVSQNIQNRGEIYQQTRM